MFENRLTARLFENRGWTNDMVRSWENGAHRSVLDSDRLVDELYEFRRTQAELTLLTDFDMDGIMSATVGLAGLAELGFNVNLYIPNHKDGYGFTPRTIGDLIAKHPNTRGILTADVGISANDGVTAAKDLGIRVFVTDHHKQDKKLPIADVIVDPMRDDDGYEHPAICGAHVLYQVIMQFARKYENAYVQEQIRRLRVFAGIGTVSDSMPLRFENRALVRDAIAICRLVYSEGSDFVVRHMYGHALYQSAFRGLYKVLKKFEVSGVLKSSNDIDADFFGFYLAPMFNSVKRIGAPWDMARAMGVFFERDPEAVDGHVDYLYDLNKKRRIMVREYTDDLRESVQEGGQPYAPYLYISDAEPGILGLLATQCVTDTGLPCVVITNDKGRWKGSGRSTPWYPFMTRARDEGGFHVAGHDSAFGIGFRSTTDFAKFRDFVREDAAKAKASMDASQYEVRPDFVIDHDGGGDTVIDIMLFLEFLDECERLKPFGAGFQKPYIELRFRSDDSEWTRIGNMKQHLKIRLAHGFELLAFNQGHLADLKDRKRDWRAYGELGVNVFRGVQTVQFIGDLDCAGLGALMDGD